jgi:hypothetical protein
MRFPPDPAEVPRPRPTEFPTVPDLPQRWPEHVPAPPPEEVPHREPEREPAPEDRSEIAARKQ